MFLNQPVAHTARDMWRRADDFLEVVQALKPSGDNATIN